MVNHISWEWTLLVFKNTMKPNVFFDLIFSKKYSINSFFSGVGHHCSTCGSLNHVNIRGQSVWVSFRKVKCKSIDCFMWSIAWILNVIILNNKTSILLLYLMYKSILTKAIGFYFIFNLNHIIAILPIEPIFTNTLIRNII